MAWLDTRSTGERGAAAVEFALVSVLFFTLIFGIIQYGFYFYQLTNATHASREAARLVAVGVTDCATWQSTVISRGIGARVNGAAYSMTTPYQAGSTATVTITWKPTRMGLPYVPFLAAGNQTITADTRVEYLPVAGKTTC